jgi:hypothetical protein
VLGEPQEPEPDLAVELVAVAIIVGDEARPQRRLRNLLGCVGYARMTRSSHRTQRPRGRIA